MNHTSVIPVDSHLRKNSQEIASSRASSGRPVSHQAIWQREMDSSPEKQVSRIRKGYPQQEGTIIGRWGQGLQGPGTQVIKEGIRDEQGHTFCVPSYPSWWFWLKLSPRNKAKTQVLDEWFEGVLEQSQGWLNGSVSRYKLDFFFISLANRLEI